jgi:hypothetical protein
VKPVNFKKTIASQDIYFKKVGPGPNVKSFTVSSYPPAMSVNLGTISNGDISNNTSRNHIPIDAEDNLQFTDEDEEADDEDAQQVAMVDSCFNLRFVKHNDCISKSKMRTIYRGYDNDSGCEIAWTTYILHNYKRDKLLKALDIVKEISHKNILRVFYYEVRKVVSSANKSSIASHSGTNYKGRISLKSSKSVELTSF